MTASPSRSPPRPSSDPGESAAARTSPDRHAIGRRAEQRAGEELVRAGFQIVARNYRCRMGELDLVGRRGALLVIAEVRLRSHSRYGGAAASITAAKRARLIRATRHLLMCRPALAGLAVRFDALLVSAGTGRVEWIEAAFAID